MRILLPKNKPLILIFSLLFIIAITLIALTLRQPTVTIISTQPINQSGNVTLSQNITLTLSHPLPNNQELSFESQPPITGRFTFNDQRTQATFIPLTLYQPNTLYTINFSTPSNTSYQYQFTTLMPKTFANLIEQSTANTNNPTPPTQTANPTPTISLAQGLARLIGSTPYQADNFEIRYVVVTERFLVYLNNPLIDDQIAQEEALNYFRSFGITDPMEQLKISIISSKQTEEE